MIFVSGEKIKALYDYWDTTLFDELFILNPTFSVNGKLSNEQLCIVKKSNKEIVICPDRNIFGRLLSAVKKGGFSGEYRKQTTAFLLWTSFNNFSLLPFDAIREQAFPYRDNKSANKELTLFDTLSNKNVITDEILFESFFHDGIFFRPLSFVEADERERVYFIDDIADYFFLYGSILHFVYVLRSTRQPDEQFRIFFNWYLKNDNLISKYALTYFALYFANVHISPPHWYMQNDKAIRGCKNQAFDLCYLEFLNPTRYANDSFELFFATCDKGLKTVFGAANNRYINSDCFFNSLFMSLPDSKRIQYVNLLTEALSQHKKPEVSCDNALGLARKFANEQEMQLSEYLRWVEKRE